MGRKAMTVAQLHNQYVSIAGWDVYTREATSGYIRRTIKPALGPTQVRKVSPAAAHRSRSLKSYIMALAEL